MPESPNKLLNNDHGNYVYATYTGHIFDTTLDIYFCEARFYDANTRTWLAMDPIKDGDNWYQYCYSNPLKYWDPLGLAAYDPGQPWANRNQPYSPTSSSETFTTYDGCNSAMPWGAREQYIIDIPGGPSGVEVLIRDGNAILEIVIPPLGYKRLSYSINLLTIMKNYENNSANDITGKAISDQRAEEIEILRYGYVSAKYGGCGPISVYNALYLLGQEPSMKTVIAQFEGSGNIALGGWIGSNPYGFGKVLDQYDVSYESYNSISKMEKEMQDGDAAILSVWNNKDNFVEGMHFYTVQKAANGYEIYNGPKFEDSQTLEEVVGNGRFINGYIVKENKN